MGILIRHGLRPLDTLGQLQGGWKRVGRQVAGSPLEEVSDVWWLQVGAVFADLRVCRDERIENGLLDASQAFSGAVGVFAGTVTFRHDLDTEYWGESDRAHLFRGVDLLVEVGRNYLERWSRITATGADRGVVIEMRGGVVSRPLVFALQRPAPDLRIVATGVYAIAIWDKGRSGGAAFSRGEKGWEVLARVGDQSGFSSAFELLPG